MSQDLQSDEREWISRAKVALDRTVSDLDQPTVLRLQRGRLAALAASSGRPAWIPWATGFAVVSVAALTVFLWMRQPAPQPHAAVSLDDVELVTSVENVELAEDLEFFHWLAGDDTTG